MTRTKILMKQGVLLFVVLLFFSGCKRGKEYYRESGERFHTYYHITYESIEPLTESIDSTMSAFNAVLNNFQPDTYVSRWNKNEVDSLHPMMSDILEIALDVSQKTGGVYDITGAPLFDLWGFGTKKGVKRLATKEEVDSVLSFVGYQKIIVDTLAHKLIKKDKRLIINPSSISKGYVTDLVAKTLEEKGVSNYMVEIGGEIVVAGVNPKGECWRIGVNSPKAEDISSINDLIYKIDICEKRGLASSGDYRNYKELGGKKVAHTIDVKSGYPAHQDVLSATIIAPSCKEADAWATAVMSVGLEKGKELLEKESQLSALLIYADSVTGEYRTYSKGVEFLSAIR